MDIHQLNDTLAAHCLDMKRDMPGFLYYGILRIADGTTLAKAQADGNPLANSIQEGSAYHVIIINQVKQIVNSNSGQNLVLDSVLIETDKITFILTISVLGKFFSITALETAKTNLGVSRALLSKCKAEFGPILDNTF